MKLLITHVTLILALSVGLYAAAHAQDAGKSCTLMTLRGTYVFAADGYNIVAGIPQPKAIVEVMELHGDGTIVVGAVTLSTNGTITQPPPGGVGNYSVDESCAGTITFTPGPSFSIVVEPHGKTIWMIQTNPNTVLQGTATRVSH